jgi:hypothetical protein
MASKSDRVRHAISRQTGATTLTRIEGDNGEWVVRCLNHDQKTTVGGRGPAWKAASHPSNFCSKCKAFASG